MTPLKHAKLIKAWADGATIQKQNKDGEWVDVHQNWPWYDDWTYRIKPAHQPDMVFYGQLDEPVRGSFTLGSCFTREYVAHDKIKVVFDGSTGKLKSVEAL